MKILDVCGFYSETGGGVASYVRQKLLAAEKAGHEVVVIAPGAESRVEERHGGKIAWVAAPKMPFDANYHVFVGAREAWSIIDAEAPDIIEGSSPWRGGWIAATWAGAAVRTLVFHQDFVAGYPHTLLGPMLPVERIDRLFAPYWAYVRRLSQRFEATITGGAWLADRLASFGVNRPIAVPFGIETALFSPVRRDEAVRRELLSDCGAPPTSRLLIAVGRLHPEKRHRTLIEAFAALRRRRDDVALAIVGDGLIRSRIEQLAAKVPGIGLIGAVSDRQRLAAIYASADVLVHGSGAETYGLVVAEAIASGLIVVTPDTGGAADLARQGASEIYRTGDSNDCALAIERALGRLGEARPASRITDFDDHFTALFGLYETLIAGRAAARS